MAAVAGRPSALQRGSCKLQQTAAGLRHGGTHGPCMTRSTVVVVIASIAALVVLVLAGRRVLERDREALYARYAAVRTQAAEEAAHEVAFDTPPGAAEMATAAMTATLDAADAARGTMQLSPPLLDGVDPTWYRVYARRSSEHPGTIAILVDMQIVMARVKLPR